LHIDSLSVEASGIPIVNGVSLALAPGEVLGLIGESGAGKSTLGLAALGYAKHGCRIVGGSVVLAGVDLLSLSEAARKRFRGTRVAYIAQSASAAFNPAQTLMQQICEVPLSRGMMSRKQARSAAVALFQRLKLPDPETFGARYPHQVSGGQLQRAMAAMAMICKPTLIVLDEPTASLDVTTQIEVLGILRSLIHEDGVSALYITHDLALVAQIATRLMVLRNGRVQEEGPTDQVLNTPRSSYARALRDARRLEAAPAVQAATDRDTLLEIRDVAARYGGGPLVLGGVSVRVDLGETLAVIGESGSGKSTLARVIVGLLPPASGEIRYRGAPTGPLALRGRELCRAIQIIHQAPDLALNPHQPVSDIIGRPLELFLRLAGDERRRRVAELLRLVGLSEDIAARLPTALSGGQKQRICIARALAAEPALLICDEITASLDVLVAKEILELLLRLKRQLGMTCILITHDFAIVQAAADRVVVMFGGRIVEEGQCTEILIRPRTDYTARLIEAVPKADTGWLDRVLAE